MGSDSPFLDDTIPFSEHARGMKDDELLDIWETQEFKEIAPLEK